MKQKRLPRLPPALKKGAPPPTVITTPRVSPAEALNRRRSQGKLYFERVYPHREPAAEPEYQKWRASFLASAYGDSMGMPFESKPPIEQWEVHREWVQSLTDPTNTFKEYLQKGGWTDDTQLKVAVMESILSAGGVDMESIADYHVRSYNVGPRGWGGSTRESVQRLKRGVPWQRSGKAHGAGNGIAMKVGPIGALYGIRYGQTIEPGSGRWSAKGVNLYSRLANDIRNIAIMTHLDTRAIVSGFVQAVLVAWALNGISPQQNWNVLMDKVRKLEEIFPKTDTSFSSRLEFIERNPDRDIEFYAHLFRTGCFVLESHVFSIATYMKLMDDPIKAVQAAVHAGGDCDTTASIVGELCGAYSGSFSPPDLEDLEEYQQLSGVCNEFYRFAKHQFNVL